MEAAKKLWNSMAAEFAEMEIPKAENNFTIKLITENSMCGKDQKALDVGCGAGRYAIALSGLGMKVEANDFSEAMIKAARECAKIHQAEGIAFSVEDWSQLDICERGWEKSFDLVLCSMTPAIRDEETIRKAILACRGWLLITKPCRRTNSVRDALRRELNLQEDLAKSDDQMKLAFDLLWQMGKNPQLQCEEQIWENQRPLEEALNYYTCFVESTHGALTEIQKEALKKYLTKIAVNGMVEEKTVTTVYALYCRVEE